MAVFSQFIDRHRVVGAGAHSDTMRFRREIADSLGTRRPNIEAHVLGQHGDHLVPAWSTVRVDGTTSAELEGWIAAQRANRSLGDLSHEITEHRGELLALIADGAFDEAFKRVAALQPDLRAALKPFLVHFTAGRTTEIVTAHAVGEVVAVVLGNHDTVLSLQVHLEGELYGLHGIGAVPVRFNREGWSDVVDVHLADDEREALRVAFAAVETANAGLLSAS